MGKRLPTTPRSKVRAAIRQHDDPGKVCTKCGVWKNDDDFRRDKRGIHGRRSECRICHSATVSRYRLKNIDRVKANLAKWSSEHKDYISEYGKKWRAANSSRKKAKMREWYVKNREHKDASDREWRARNPDKVISTSRKSHAKTYSTPKGKINSSIRRLMLLSIKKDSKNKRRWEDLVGFTASELKLHLEKHFTPEMTWNNHGSYWHIDHKIPIAAFNFETPEDLDFKRCWSLDNLMPLEAVENCSKGAKVDSPFQPSLSIEVR